MSSAINKSVLIADDDPTIREVYAHAFREHGFTVFEANDGLEALNQIRARRPAVVFTGIMMPNMDGFELLKVIKSNVETSHIPVLINSHLGREEDRQKAKELGAQEFVVKGLTTPKDIAALASQILSQKVYRVLINSNGMDAAKMISDLNLDPSAPIVLELVRKPESTDLTARIV